MLSDQIKGNIDALLVSETKTDDSFPIENFLIDGFSTSYRLERNSNGGGLMLFVREDISSNLVEAEAKPIEGFYIELNLRNGKWLLNCSYNPHKNNVGKLPQGVKWFFGFTFLNIRKNTNFRLI